MGIPRLYGFVVKPELNSFHDIDIIEEIDDWYRKNNGKPTIVVDFQRFTHAVCDDPLDSFFGCRSKHCFETVKQFFSVFQQKGVNLVFFDEGTAQEAKTESVISRQNTRFENIFKILDDLYECNSVDKLIKKYDIRHQGCLISGVRTIAREFGEFHTSYHNLRNKELVAYATKVNALAIFSDDTNFLIFKGNYNYWSTKHINLNTLTTKGYSKINLLQYLKLTEDEMPLFATLAGNDIIPVQLLDRFHRYLGNPWHKFQNITKYIRNMRNLNNYEPDFIARKVFGNIKELTEYTELIRKSLNSYNLDILAVNEIQENDNMLRIKNLNSYYYEIILDLSQSCTISYFDVRTPQFEKYPSLSLDLIRREMGIILQHKNDKTLTRHIYCYQNGRYVYETLYPEYPPISVPNLEDLCNADKKDELKIVKLQLLCWVLSIRLDISAIINIDKKYFSACLSLVYMVQNAYITVKEADIFLHMIETVHEKFSTIIDLPHLERVDPHAFQIVFLYDKVYQHIKRSITCCGLLEMKEHNQMDGLYFHYAYNKMNEMASIAQTNAHLGQLRLYDGLILIDE